MIEVALIILTIIAITLLPRLIAYIALLYLFIQGWAFNFVEGIQISLGGVTIHPLDIIYAAAAIFALIYFFKITIDQSFKSSNTLSTKRISLVILIYVFFFIGKAINGYFEGVPLDTIVRFTMDSTQVFYFFLPIVLYKHINQFKHLLYFTIILSLLFPLGQPFLIHSELTQTILQGQGTLRLGYGDASILLALGVIAFFCWDQKRYMSSIPLAGIFMLAHRSAFIGIALALMAQAFIKGKQIKTVFLMGLSGAIMIGFMLLVTTFTNVDILSKSLNRASETFTSTGTTTARYYVIFTAIEELEKRPISGLSYKEAYDLRKVQSRNARAFNILTPHNFVLYSIMRHGLFGTIILLYLMYNSLKTAKKISLNPQHKEIGAYIYGSMIFCIIFGLMNNTLEGVGYVFWFLCGSSYWFSNQQLITSKT
jgi:hypothetical protein